MTDQNDSKALQVTTQDSVKKEVITQSQNTDTSTIEQSADQFVEKLLAFDANQVAEKESGRSSVESMGADTQRDAIRMSEMLSEPIRTISKRGSNDGEVGNALIQLKMKVEELDPAKFDFEAGWFSRALGKLPGVGDPLKRYFTKYESAQTVIKAIVLSLDKGRDELLRDNQTMLDDQKEMWAATTKLQKAITLAQMIDQKLAAKAVSVSNPDQKRFIEEELLFSLRQRTIDLQQQLAVNQQGVVAMELIMRNNKELVRGVNRATSVTLSALQVGVTVAIALEKQKDVLAKVNAVSSTTSDLIASTAARLKTQGAEIQKQASSGMLNMDSLKSAFTDLNSALDDISKFRTNALPQMAQTVIDLDKLTAGASKTLTSIEQSKKQGSVLKIDVQ
jgi:uncharacterized protein YaaN involved in tellurite resistance